ncbi:MAG: methyltransferase domain-containing protein [Burkholderiales bacterium]|jgi:phospholipid N-methyltransferase|nr:MAG: methyltransferase domain-containing protein [Burkholderiales bacterium]
MRRDHHHATGAGVARAELAQAPPAVEQRDGQAAGPLQALRERLAFLRGFIAHPQQVGSVIPSSHVLEQRLVRSAQLQRARCVVELGPGTGGTTRAFLRALPASSQLLAIELSEDFAARLRTSARDPRLAVVQGSAEFVGRFLAELGLPAPDAVISGIPFSTMPREVAGRIAAEVARLIAPGGRFVAYQVRPHVAAYVTPHLGEPRREWEPINIPPVRVFTWTRHG